MQAFAARHQLRQAHKYYKQLRRDFKGLVGQTLANRRMFELLIENLCRARNVKLALQVRGWGPGAVPWGLNLSCVLKPVVRALAYLQLSEPVPGARALSWPALSISLAAQVVDYTFPPLTDKVLDGQGILGS